MNEMVNHVLPAPTIHTVIWSFVCDECLKNFYTTGDTDRPLPIALEHPLHQGAWATENGPYDG